MTLFLKRLFNLNHFYAFTDRGVHISSILTHNSGPFSVHKMSGQEFKGEVDHHNGITVDSGKENCTLDAFPKKLEVSLKLWEAANRKGIWFKVGLNQTHWVPELAKNGFDFHHAKNGYVMMYKWLPKTPCGIPEYAHTMMAVGALVINSKNQILAVKERVFLAGHWKFPGGTVEPGEDLIDTAKREVKEETNIDFEFKTIVCSMHANKGNFGCSDYYTLVAGRALNEDIIKCDREIEDCNWFDINLYLKREDVTPFNKEILTKYIEYEENNITIGFKQGVHKLSKREYLLYSVNFHK